MPIVRAFAGDSTITSRPRPAPFDSVVFDLGGYKGQFASDIYSKYFSRIYVFEPVKKFADAISERFQRNSSITVFPFALGKKNAEETIYLSADATSTHRQSGTPEKIKFVQFSEFLSRHQIHTIDLLKINIEGGEYDLLGFLIESDVIKRIKNIQVQFHDFIPNAAERMKTIQKKFDSTHELTYQYRFIWENWKLKTP